MNVLELSEQEIIRRNSLNELRAHNDGMVTVFPTRHHTKKTMKS